MNNIPIEMISVCSADGKLRPLRFRFEDEYHRLHTIRVAEILVSKELFYVGQQAYQYTCKAMINEKEQLFELRYTVKSHKWVLFRLLN